MKRSLFFTFIPVLASLSGCTTLQPQDETAAPAASAIEAPPASPLAGRWAISEKYVTVEGNRLANRYEKDTLKIIFKADGSFTSNEYANYHHGTYLLDEETKELKLTYHPDKTDGSQEAAKAPQDISLTFGYELEGRTLTIEDHCPYHCGVRLTRQ